MFGRIERLLVTTFALAAFCLPALAQAESARGPDAPAFTLPSAEGKQVSLSDFEGKVVVLEWTNAGCPFVRKHYDSGNMQSLQKQWKEKGVVWLTINSSAKGKQGYVDAEGAKKEIAENKAAPTAYLLDHDGKVGKAYRAKATPHMFVIDEKGKIAYTGAIDDKRTANVADIPKAQNLVSLALEAVLAGKKVNAPATLPYGCAMKYAD